MDKGLTQVMKKASTAIYLDSENRHVEAYIQYLQCLSTISAQLLQNVMMMGDGITLTKAVQKYVQLGQQCMERIGIILDKLGQNKSGGKSTELQHSQSLTTKDNESTMGLYSALVPPLSLGSSLSQKKSTGITPMEMAYKQNQQLLTAYKSRMARMKNKAATNLSLTVQRKMAENLAIAKAREEALAKKMKERQLRLEEQASRRFSTPTGMSKEEQQQRQTYKKILEYEQDAKWLLEWRSKLEQKPKDATLIHQLIMEILRCEDHPLTQLLKKYQYKLYERLYPIVAKKMEILQDIKVSVDNNNDNPPNISELLSPCTPNDSTSVFLVDKLDYIPENSTEPSDGEAETQISMDSKSLPNIKMKGGDEVNIERNESRSNVESETQDNETQSRQSVENETEETTTGHNCVHSIDLISTNTDDSDPERPEVMTPDVQDRIKEDLESAIIGGDDLSKELKRDNASIILNVSKSLKKSLEEYEDEISDEIWGSDMEDAAATYQMGDSMRNVLSEDNIGADGKVHRSESMGSSDSCDSNTARWRSLYSQWTRPEEEEMLRTLKNEAYFRHLKGISEDVHSYMEELQVMFTVAYEQLDSPEGKDQCYASLEEPFYKPLWVYLLALFRLANVPKEMAVAEIMSTYHTVLPKDVGVPPKLCLTAPPGEHEEDDLPYGPAITELMTLDNFSSPLTKIECLVRVSRQVCKCVEDHYEGTKKKQPQMGADDLLPIITYVIMRSKLPQVVSEIHAMEEFIHEGYLMGEEGYCLTTLQTAVNYIISLHQRTSHDKT